MPQVSFKGVGAGGRAVAGKTYDSVGQTTSQMQAAADARNCTIRYPLPNELFIDIDSASAYTRFKQLLAMFEKFIPVERVTATPSASGGQHQHIVVALTQRVTEFERIAYQAILGSDPKREVLSLERLKTGTNPTPTVFFEPKPGVRPVAKKTGHNCAVCNQRNDFAEANQDDGTYVCFNCRIED